jgi:hypothetical protein
MQEERFLDKQSDDWIDGYEYGRSFQYQQVMDKTNDNDELYCIEKIEGILWYMIDTKTALEWGL